MGALEYKPQLMHAEKYEDFDFDWLSLQCKKIWKEEDSEVRGYFLISSLYMAYAIVTSLLTNVGRNFPVQTF